MGAAARHITLPAPGEPNAPGPFAFADPDRVRVILSRSGFADIEIDRLTQKVGGGTLDETTEMLVQLGPLADALNGLEEATQRAIRADIRAALTRFELAGHVLLDATAWLVTACSADRDDCLSSSASCSRLHARPRIDPKGYILPVARK
jgi:hypothetical protein